MANYTMHHLNVGSDTYEMVDEQGRANIASDFSTSTAYSAGDYVIYGGKLYQFTSAHTGAWTGTDAEEMTVSEDISQLKEDIGDLSDLETEAKTDLVSAINEANQHGGGSGGITVVDTVAEMVNIEAVYLYNGIETGYTEGHWYFYNTGTSAWTDGGQYTGWETVDTALENFLEENAQEMRTLTVVVGSTTYTYNGSANVSITMPVYNGGVS